MVCFWWKGKKEGDGSIEDHEDGSRRMKKQKTQAVIKRQPRKRKRRDKSLKIKSRKTKQK